MARSRFIHEGEVNATNVPGKGLSTNKIFGYTPIREFYSPNYDRFDARHDDPDVRTTIYWNAAVIVKPKKPAKCLSIIMM
jgi:hypothetical protein